MALWEIVNSKEHHKSNHLHNLRKYYNKQFAPSNYISSFHDPMRIYRNGQEVYILNWNDENNYILVEGGDTHD